MEASADRSEFPDDPESAALVAELAKAHGTVLSQVIERLYTGDQRPDTYFIPLSDLLHKSRVSPRLLSSFSPTS